MEPDGEVWVDPAQLLTGANVCRELRESLVRAITGVEPETISAEKALHGFLLQKALRDLFEEWRDDLGKHGGRLDATADALEACARDYQTSDHASMGYFHKAMLPW